MLQRFIFCTADVHVSVSVTVSLGLRTKCPVFLSTFNNVCIFLLDFNRSLGRQISRKSVQWQAVDTCGQADSQVGS